MTIPKFFYEMSILIIFVCLFKKFNKMSQDYQAEQKANQSNLVTYSKILAIFVCTLYLINTLLFNIISPLFLYLTWQEGDEQHFSFTKFLFHLDWIMAIADFMSCMAILFLIH